MTTTFPAARLRATNLSKAVLAGNIIAWGRRTSNSTAASAEQEVLRIDGVAVTEGRIYHVMTASLAFDTTVSADSGRALLRYTTSGTATTSSTVMQVSPTYCGNAAQQDTVMISVLYVPSADETLSLLLTTARLAGTGNVSLAAAATSPIDLFVIDCGESPGDTGVDL